MKYQDITFQVTLPTGAIATSPRELGFLTQQAEGQARPIITSDGRVLVPPPAPSEDAAPDSPAAPPAQ